MLRRGVDLAALGRLDNAAEIHDSHAAADVLDHRQVMGDEKKGKGELLLQVFQEIDHLGLDRNVKRRNRLVANDQLRLDRQRPRNPDSLTLATGEFVWIAARMIRLQPN